MRSGNKPICLSGHAKQQLSFRGTTEAEVVDAIRRSEWLPAELGRLECKREFSFNSEWNGKRYATKQVRPIFIEGEDEIVVVTVYVYYY